MYAVRLGRSGMRVGLTALPGVYEKAWCDASASGIASAMTGLEKHVPGAGKEFEKVYVRRVRCARQCVLSRTGHVLSDELPEESEPMVLGRHVRPPTAIAR